MVEGSRSDCIIKLIDLRKRTDSKSITESVTRNNTDQSDSPTPALLQPDKMLYSTAPS
jgi:hypothetical protein